MSSYRSLTTAQTQAVFTEEIAAREGVVTDAYDDGARLFTRSILAWVEEVRPGDGPQGGVAMRATEREAWLHPYVFRQVCRNGAIWAQAIQTQHVEGLDQLSPEEADTTLREAVRACCVEEA